MFALSQSSKRFLLNCNKTSSLTLNTTLKSGQKFSTLLSKLSDYITTCPRYLDQFRYYCTFNTKKSKGTLPEGSLNITEAVSKRILQLQELEKNKNLYLRITVDSGGCNGYLTKLEIDDKSLEPEDLFMEKSGAKIVMDQISVDLMKGSTIDFVDEMARSAFIIQENPNAGTSCGCNTSFSLKNNPK